MADAAQPGPLVGRGRSADVAYSWIILKTAAPPRLTITTRLMSAFGRGAFLSLFVRHFDPAEVKRTIPQAADFRLTDRTPPPSERKNVARLAKG